MERDAKTYFSAIIVMAFLGLLSVGMTIGKIALSNALEQKSYGMSVHHETGSDTALLRPQH